MLRLVMRRHRTSAPGTAPGFSLIEALVVVSILGLLLVAIMPSIGNTLRNIEIRNAAEAIQNGLTKARAEAVKRNEPVTFSLLTHNATSKQLDNSCALSNASTSWVVSRADPTNSCDIAASETAAPLIIAKRSQGDGSPNVTARVKEASGGDPCGADDDANSVSFNGYGRVIAPSWGTGPIKCVLVENRTDTGTRKLQVLINAGGTVRMCDPAVTDGNDPRKC
jgi:type IV fimbrial biogenesis protein FimT